MRSVGAVLDFLRKSSHCTCKKAILQLKNPVPLVLQGPVGNVNAAHYPWYSRNTLSAEDRAKHYANCENFAETLMPYVEKTIPTISTKPLTVLGKHIEEIFVPISPVYEHLDKQGWRISGLPMKRSGIGVFTFLSI